MSQENVEVVRRANDAWNAGDMNAFHEALDPEVILRTVEDWPEQGPYVGRDAVLRFYEQLRSAWDADTVEFVSEFFHAADRVAVRLSWNVVSRGPTSNLEVTTVYGIRRGRIDRVEFFWDHGEALEAVGLSE
jgi:ketosteroid isomerase-like protein